MHQEVILQLLKAIKPYEQITEGTELVRSGILDSLAIMNLITRLEEELDIEIAEDAITAENFATVQDIERLVQTSRKI